MKKSYFGFSALYMFSYMALGVLMPLIGQYLDYIGFSGTQIGTVTAAGTCVAIFASTIWGSFYDASKNKYRLVFFLCLMAAAVGQLLLQVKSYMIFLPVYGVLYFFQAPIMAFSDTLTLEESMPFSQVRKWGAVGFALGVFGAGRIAGLTGIPVIFYLYSMCFAVSALLLLLMSGGQSKEKKSASAEKRGNYLVLLKDKRLVQLILCIFFVGGTNIANNTYFSFLYIEGGGTITGLGIVMLLMVGSEAPFMQWSAGLARKFTMEKTVLGAIAVSTVRFLIYGFSPSWQVLAVLFFTQGAVNGIILVEFVRYVTKLAPEGHKGLAVAAYYAVGSSGSAIVCQLAGGVALDHFGPGGVYLFFSLFNLTGLILYLIFGLQKRGKR